MALDQSAATTQPQGGAAIPASGKWRTEDWIAVYLGFAVIIITLAAFSWKFIDLRNVTSTFRWTTDGQIASRAADWSAALEDIAKEAASRDQKDIAARASDLKAALQKGDRKEIEKAAGALQKAGGKSIPGALGGEIRGHATALAGKVFTWDNIAKAVYIGIAWLVLAAIGYVLMGNKAGPLMIGFPVVFFLAWVARVLAGNGLFVDYGVEYVIFALLMGLLVSNTIGTPKWLMPAVQTEYYIKTGLVILGAGLLFLEIIQAGVLGIIQAVLVVAVIWYVCFWISRKLRVDDDFAAMLSSAVAICGVSAAIATCGAIQGDKKKLSYVTSLVLIVAVPMMVVMPWLAKVFQFPELVAGA